MNLLERLAGVEERFHALEVELSDPSILTDGARYRDTTKKHRDLMELVEATRAYRKLLADLEGHGALAEDADPEVRALAQEELPELEARRAELEKRLLLLLLPKDPLDEKNVIVELRAGTGGEEAGLFVADLFRMYARYAERRGWKLEGLEESPGDAGGFKEAIFALRGDRVYSRLKYESGVHRVQRVPATETQGRIHTSAATVAILPEAEEVDVRIEEKDLRIDRFCSSGPGGQSVNTTYSAVRITHLPTNLVVSCQDEKSQIKNKAKALSILRSRLMQMEQDKQDAARAAERKSQVKTGDRSEKIRTWNFPQNRVTDHRIGLTLYRLADVMEGDLDLLLDPLCSHMEAEKLQAQV